MAQPFDKFVKGEMGYVMRKQDGYGMIITVHSDDHEPSHAHVLDINKNELGRFLITQKPEQMSDIKSVKGYELPPRIRQKIYEWSKEFGRSGVNNWERLIDMWDNLRPDLED